MRYLLVMIRQIIVACVLTLVPEAVNAQAMYAGQTAPVANQPICALNAIGSQLTGCQGQVVQLRVVTAAGAVTVATTDFVVVVNKGTGAATAVNLPATPATGTVFWIKDGKGDANTNNITITPAAGTIDGSSTDVINTAFGAALIVYNGTQWNVLAESSGLL